MRVLSTGLLISLGALAACSSGAGSQTGGGDFESDSPVSDNTNGSGGRAGTDSVPTPSAAGTESAGDANRAVEEADIIKREGNTLYAVSRYGGLSIIDISNPSALRMLGRFRTQAMPFEMYVRDGTAYLMLNDYGHWISGTDGYGGSWVQSSEILALDVRNPSAITALATYDVPGDISDSRMVGDVMYVVTSENGYCWSCDASKPNTTVTSFKTGGNAIRKVDQLRFSSAQPGYSYWKRSVSATNERLYVAGPEWNWSSGSAHHSVIQVVDIHDPSGVLTKGADVNVDGQIQSRWQMDEYQGVLRVVSQRGNGWGNGSIDPLVQTFRIDSASTIVPIGQTNLKLPKPESLRSVRFDGGRGYAITAERQDPLYTIDLSNPALPKQMGELEMPGWIYHMEPRGDRLVAVGYDNRNSQGSLHVSLFDVSNLAAPSMIKRVNFAQGWANLAEDQDRIHKSFQVLDDENAILVPFASYGNWNGSSCAEPKSGIQVIDYTHDNLTLRGVAEQHGQPRRAFLHDNHLFAVSDGDVSSFTFTNRDAPRKLSNFALSSPAYSIQTALGGTTVAQLSNDWWTGAAELSLVDHERADAGDELGRVSLTSLVPPSASTCGRSSSWTSWYQARLFAAGNFVHVVVPQYSYSYDGQTSQSTRTMIVGSIDVSDRANPRVVGSTSVTLEPEVYGYYGGYGFMDGYAYYNSGMYGSLVGAGESVVLAGSKLTFMDSLRTSTDWRDATVKRTVYSVDVQTPAAPVVSSLVLPYSLGSTPLIASGASVYTSAWERGLLPGRVKFYAERIELATPSPVLSRRINVPGSLLNVAGNRAVTVDYKRTVLPGVSENDCYQVGNGRTQFDAVTRSCVRINRELAVVDFTASGGAVLRTRAALPGQNLSTILASDNRLYVGLYPEYDYTQVPSSGGTTYTPVRKPGSRSGLVVLGGIESAQIAELAAVEDSSSWITAAAGTKVALVGERGLRIFETAGTPRLIASAELRGYGYTNNVLLEADRAICAMGEFGIQTVRYAP
jgi:hypothetical protein